MKMRILIADDEKVLTRAICKILEKNNYSVDTVYNGLDALSYMECGNYDAVILDLMMPGLDGISVLKKLRGDSNDVPVVILSARSEVEDKVVGLDSGANYYLTKPFDTKELLAILRTITRKNSASDTRITFGNVTLDRATYELYTEKSSIKLANKEYQVMELLLRSPKHIIPTERFIEKIWGFNNEVDTNIVWVYISYLRKKLQTLEANINIKASRNAGYSLEENE